MLLSEQSQTHQKTAEEDGLKLRVGLCGNPNQMIEITTPHDLWRLTGITPGLSASVKCIGSPLQTDQLVALECTRSVHYLQHCTDGRIRQFLRDPFSLIRSLLPFECKKAARTANVPQLTAVNDSTSDRGQCLCSSVACCQSRLGVESLAKAFCYPGLSESLVESTLFVTARVLQMPE
jgi:hypothetical protein